MRRPQLEDRSAAVDGGFVLEQLSAGMLEAVAINLIFADNDFVIRYLNPASTATLHKIEHLLPVKVADIVGSNIDIFHKNPQHQRTMLARAETFPKGSRFMLGDEWLELTASPVIDCSGTQQGVLVNWMLVTDQMRNRADFESVASSMAHSIDEIGASISEIASSASSSVDVAQQAASAVDGVNELMQRLDERLAEINEVVEFIAAVAGQTNLLALNATIEAARAGEVGRGFAVVAGEVKELANETDRATERIRSSVRGVSDDAALMTSALQDVVSLFDAVQSSSASIAAAVEEQSVVAQELSTQAQQATRALNET